MPTSARKSLLLQHPRGQGSMPGSVGTHPAVPCPKEGLCRCSKCRDLLLPLSAGGESSIKLRHFSSETQNQSFQLTKQCREHTGQENLFILLSFQCIHPVIPGSTHQTFSSLVFFDYFSSPSLRQRTGRQCLPAKLEMTFSEKSFSNL